MIKNQTKPDNSSKGLRIGLAIFSVVAASIGLFMAGRISITETIAPVKKDIVFRGEQSSLKLCDGDDLELSIFDGKLRVDCADRRKTPIRIVGPAVVGNGYIDCDGWCNSGVNIEAAGQVSVIGMTVLNSGVGVFYKTNLAGVKQ